MNSIIKTSILLATLLSVSLTAIADGDVRLIVTKKDGSSALQAKGSVSQSSINKVRTSSESLSVPEHLVSEKMSDLYKDKDVIAVERDIIVHQLASSGATYPYSVSQQSIGDNSPNDPSFKYQGYFQPRSPANIAGSNILEALAQGEQKIRPKIAVMDGGFLEEGRFDDVQPAYSYSFVSDTESNIGDSAWNSIEELPCENGHGIGVYGVVGAISNNNQHVAGIVDAEMYMLQVMRCGTGGLWNSASALRWAAAGEVDGMTTLNQPVDIATFSLGAATDRCPTYMQSSIDFAVSKGVKVFVAAGNENVPTTGFTPANCANVTVISAMDDFTGDKADFANYGEKVDVITQGTSVGGLSDLDGGIGLWSGTSFATPISTGIYGLAIAHAPSLSDELLSTLMNATLSPLDNAPTCDSVGCGKGIVDAGAFIKAAMRYEKGTFAIVESALTETALCDITPYMMASGLKARLCSAYSVSIDADMFTLNEGDTVAYKLFQWPEGERFDLSISTLLFEGVETEFLINDIDLSQQAGLVRCVNGECNNSLILPILLKDTGRPDACDE
jgi:hypothetical protein